MHPDQLFSQPPEVSDFDCTSKKAIWAISLMTYWITHPFKIANTNNRFHFNTYPLGLQANGTLRIFMMLYDPRNYMYIHKYDDINLHANIDVQLLYVIWPHGLSSTQLEVST